MTNTETTTGFVYDLRWIRQNTDSIAATLRSGDKETQKLVYNLLKSRVGGEVLVKWYAPLLEELDGLERMVDSFAPPKLAFMRMAYLRLNSEQKEATPRLGQVLFTNAGIPMISPITRATDKDKVKAALQVFQPRHRGNDTLDAMAEAALKALGR